jgi:sporulation protein YlmC with PRC-barrel domain
VRYLLRASTLIGRPVLTIGGESPLEVKDVVFDGTSGRVLGFTLRHHGFLGGPSDDSLAWEDVHGLGPDAVVVADESVLAPTAVGDAAGGDVIGNRVITEGGTPAGVVGFEIEAAPGIRPDDDHHVFIPLPDTLAISDERIIVPDSATEYLRDDLSGFGGAVDAFRSKLAGVG